MKRMQLTLLCVAFLLHGQIYAQEPLSAITQKKQVKPYLFSSLPDQFEVAASELNKMLTGNVNEKFSAQLSPQLLMEGIIVDKNQHTPGSLTFNIRLQNYQNALFNVTIQFLADNSTSIRGRIIHPRYEDVLELYKENEKYYFKKSSQRLYMPD